MDSLTLGRKIEALKTLIETTADMFGEKETFTEEVKYDPQSLIDLYEKYQNLVDKYAINCKNESSEGQTFIMKENNNFYCFNASEILELLQTKVNPHTKNKLSDKMLDYFLVINNFLIPIDNTSSVLDFLDCLHKKYPITEGYMSSVQNDLSWKMRVTLLTWLREVCHELKMSREVMFLAVTILDHYLSRNSIKRTILQGIGCAALSIACDIGGYPVEMQSLSILTDNTYLDTELLQIKLRVQKILQFTTLYPTVFRYLQEYMFTMNISKEKRAQILYYAEVTLFSEHLLFYSPNYIAQACIFIIYGNGMIIDKGVFKIAEEILDIESTFVSENRDFIKILETIYNSPQKITKLSSPHEQSLLKEIPVECKDVIQFSDEDFERIKKLGSGSFGKVYEIKNRTTGTITALKRVEFTDYSEIPYTTVNEIGILKELNHPNIIKLLNVSVSTNVIDMIFEKMDSTLTITVENIELLKFYMYQLLSGLQAIHSKGIIHRDLKGENILIKNNTLKIADFGLAIFSYPLKLLKTDVCTLWWRAPEVLLKDRQYTTAIDMWSAGVIMAELLGGLELFMGTDDQSQLLKIFTLKGTPTNKTWPGVENLPGYKKDFPEFKANQSPIIPNFTDKLGNDLLDKLLAMDPVKRITAAEALHHPFLKIGKALEF